MNLVVMKSRSHCRAVYVFFTFESSISDGWLRYCRTSTVDTPGPGTFLSNFKHPNYAEGIYENLCLKLFS